MNPFSQNPFDLADNAGLRLAERGIAMAYRRWRVSPVASRHVPRVTFVLFFTLTAFAGPADKAAILPVAAIFALVAVARILPDLPSMRIEWNADLYRRYGAMALREREILLFRRILITFIAIALTFGAAILSSKGMAIIGPIICFFMMQMSLVFGHWAEAAELPEPDDGDFYARPHAA